MKDEDLPKPILKAYAFTEWTWDPPKRPNGADLWAPVKCADMFEIWYSPINWQKVFEETGEGDWEYSGHPKWENHLPPL